VILRLNINKLSLSLLFNILIMDNDVILGNKTSIAGNGLLEPRTSIPLSKFNVHETHCCAKHGCKYGYKDCPVVLNLTKQEYECEYGDYMTPCFDKPIDEMVDIGAELYRNELIDKIAFMSPTIYKKKEKEIEVISIYSRDAFKAGVKSEVAKKYWKKYFADNND
jgi:hypothetical protein